MRKDTKLCSREASLDKINDAVGVVEGANLIHNEYGNRLFADFFSLLLDFTASTFSREL